MPQAPSVGDSQLSSSKRMSCASMCDAARLEALQIEVLHLVRRRLQDHLELMVLVEAIRVLAVAAVGRPARRLHVGDVPVRRPEHAQEGLGRHRAGADFQIERLLDEASLPAPVLRQLEDEILKGHESVSSSDCGVEPAGRSSQCCISRSTRVERSSFSRCHVMSVRCTSGQLARRARRQRRLAEPRRADAAGRPQERHRRRRQRAWRPAAGRAAPAQQRPRRRRQPGAVAERRRRTAGRTRQKDTRPAAAAASIRNSGRWPRPARRRPARRRPTRRAGTAARSDRCRAPTRR